MPAPPCASAIVRPNTPRCAISAITSSGIELVAQVPAVRGFGMVVGEARELLAHLVQRGVVVAGVAEAARRRAFGQQRGDAPAHCGREAFGAQALHGGIGVEGGERVVVQRVGTEELALAHRQPTRQLRQVFAVGRLQQQRFQFAEAAAACSRCAQASICCNAAT